MVVYCLERVVLSVFFYFKEVGTISKDRLINEEIRDKELRVIGDDGEQLGVMSRDEALRISEEKNLDLVCVSPNAKPPVCKILDYGKFRYELQKKEKEAKKKQATTQTKEIAPKIGRASCRERV